MQNLWSRGGHSGGREMTESEALRIAKGALIAANALFVEIRGDWTDPRADCRAGRDVCAAGIAAIDEALGAADGTARGMNE